MDDVSEGDVQLKAGRVKWKRWHAESCDTLRLHLNDSKNELGTTYLGMHRKAIENFLLVKNKSKSL